MDSPSPRQDQTRVSRCLRRFFTTLLTTPKKESTIVTVNEVGELMHSISYIFGVSPTDEQRRSRGLHPHRQQWRATAMGGWRGAALVMSSSSPWRPPLTGLPCHARTNMNTERQHDCRCNQYSDDCCEATRTTKNIANATTNFFLVRALLEITNTLHGEKDVSLWTEGDEVAYTVKRRE